MKSTSAAADTKRREGLEAVQKDADASRRQLLLARLKRGIPLYLMIAVPLIWYFIFCYIPMGGLVMVFQDYNVADGFLYSPWCDQGIFGHFEYFLTYPKFWEIFRNTVLLGTFNTLFCFPAPIILALFFNELKQGRFKKVVQTVSYLPYFVSTIALINIVMVMLSGDGVVNQLLLKMGKEAVPFRSLSRWVIPIYVLINLWRSVGWGTIIYVAAMSNIGPELYEAADIDGAGRLTKIFRITLPQILPTIVILFILGAPGLVSADFETMFLLGTDETRNVSEVVSTWIYRLTFNNSGLQEYSLSAAVGLFSSVVNLVVVLSVNYVANRVSDVGLF